MKMRATIGGIERGSRDSLIEETRIDVSALVGLTQRLVAIPSAQPEGNTRALADEIATTLAAIPDVEVETFDTSAQVRNVVGRWRSSKPGRRLIFNGHLDTFPLVNAEHWTADPAGEIQNGRIYGVGVSDMKGGLAAGLFALRHIATHANGLSGEIVCVYAGDEENMGALGTQWLIDNVPHVIGDANICADVGSPSVLRFGEKGMIWLKLTASGRSAHAAHVHKGDCAIERLIDAIRDLSQLRKIVPHTPPEVEAAIQRAAATSESLSGKGETDVLRSVTMTFGTIQGGRLSNLIADRAVVTADIRLPVGVTVSEVESQIHRIVADHEKVGVEIMRRFEPTWTDPKHEIIQILRANCNSVLGQEPVVNMRVGASDSRLYRPAGVPTVVCGLTPNNMGAANEYVEIAELHALGQIFAASAFDFLNHKHAQRDN